jgi:hypothetical protein
MSNIWSEDLTTSSTKHFDHVKKGTYTGQLPTISIKYDRPHAMRMCRYYSFNYGFRLVKTYIYQKNTSPGFV